MKYSLLFVLLFSGFQCLHAQDAQEEFDKNFVHTVYFWLKKPDNKQDRSDFERSLKKFLKTSKYAKTHFIGIPAETPRSVVDNSWTYSLVLTFPSKEVQDLYQDEDVHHTFIEESEALWERVQVYDSVGLK